MADVAANNLGSGSSLLGKHHVILASRTAGNTGASCNQLGVFVDEAQAQSGRKLTAIQANLLIGNATRIENVLA